MGVPVALTCQFVALMGEHVAHDCVIAPYREIDQSLLLRTSCGVPDGWRDFHGPVPYTSLSGNAWWFRYSKTICAMIGTSFVSWFGVR